eukprot:558417-Amphidinium_carterae.1
MSLLRVRGHGAGTPCDQHGRGSSHSAALLEHEVVVGKEGVDPSRVRRAEEMSANSLPVAQSAT